MGEVRTRDVREISDLAAVIDVKGDVTAASESALMPARERPSRRALGGFCSTSAVLST
jgi:hypothetical protein